MPIVSLNESSCKTSLVLTLVMKIIRITLLPVKFILETLVIRQIKWSSNSLWNKFVKICSSTVFCLVKHQNTKKLGCWNCNRVCFLPIRCMKREAE